MPLHLDFPVVDFEFTVFLCRKKFSILNNVKNKKKKGTTVMAKLSKDTFTLTIIELLQERGIHVEETRVKKTNDSHNGITLKNIENGTVIPIIDTDKIYASYLNDSISLAKAVDEIEKIFKENPVIENEDYIKKLNDFEYVKNHLVIEVYGADKNQDVLENCIHAKFEDLAIIPKIHLGSINADGQLTCTVPTGMLDEYGVSNDEFLVLAIKSSQELRPAKIINFDDIILSGYVDTLIMSGQVIENKQQKIQELKDDGFLLPPKTFDYIVSNEGISHGAASIFYPGVLAELYKNIGESFYLIPSSIHEMLIIPCSRSTGASLKEIVYEINRNRDVLSDAEILTDSVYVYDGHALRQLLDN